MIDIMFTSLVELLTTPHIIGLMLIAVVFGLLVGVTPGIGGKLSIAMAIPFVSEWTWSPAPCSSSPCMR